MNIEDFRLRTSADGLRASVLGAARRAVRERRLWRWTWVAAAVVLFTAIPINLSLEGTARPSMPPASAETDEGLRLRYRLASTPRAAAFPREEIR
jgi:hypothetical protein